MAASDVRLYFRLQRAAHLMKKAADRALLEAAGLTTAQAAVLIVAGSVDRPTQRAVATALGLNESAVTAMAGRLIALDYLERTRCPADRRAWLLRPTETGRRALDRIAEPFGRINRRIDEALGADDVHALAAVLARLTKGFDDA